MPTREHHRVRIHLPARLRWTTPFGQKIELSETLDVSRGGLLLSSQELHSAGASLWVTFPYDASLPDGQPEVLARVVRCGEALAAIGTTGARAKSLAQAGSAHARSAKPGKLARRDEVTEAPARFAVALHFEEQTHLGS